MKRDLTAATAVRVPVNYPASLVFMDESNAKASGSSFFVMSAVKLREPGLLARNLRMVRDRNQFEGEFKFSQVTKGTMCAYFDAIDQLVASAAHLAASVVDRTRDDPYPGLPVWEMQLQVAARLLVGCINRRELVSVVLDGISTPVGVALDDQLRREVNRRLRSTSVVTAACMDSRSSDGLQIADLVAGAIAFERRQYAGLSGRTRPSATSPKAKVAERLRVAFGLTTFHDTRTERVNIATLSSPKKPATGLRIVGKSPA